MSNREVLRIVAVGHVDHGKSTVIGRLLYDTNSIHEARIERVKEICREKGKNFEYAFLLDAFEEEQKQGITIDTTELQFHTEKRDYVIIDAPGHKEFLKNMISGAASAEAALLIIDSNEGIMEQSKRHGYILSLLGIKQVYVVVNKMDLIDYSEEKFNNIREKIGGFLASVGVNVKNYIPISAFYGENLSFKSEKMSWYKGETILKSLDLFEKEVEDTEKELRFPIQDVYKFDHRRIIVGKIESGSLNVGQEVQILPSRKKTRVKSIEYFVERDKTESLKAGQSVGITLEDEFFNKRGEIITTINSSAKVSKIIKANVVWMGKAPLVKNKNYKIKLVTQEVIGEVVDFTRVIDASTLKEEENREEVKINEVAEITIRLKEKLAFDKFSDNRKTGRFVIVDGYNVSGGGIISSFEEEDNVENTVIRKGDDELRVEFLNDNFYSLQNSKIIEEKREGRVYEVGERIETKGETFNYFESFNVISLEDNLVAQIREGIVHNLVSLKDFEYDRYHFIDKKGFGVNIFSKEDFDLYVKEYEELISLNHHVVAFYNEWLNFGAYRNIKYV